METPLFPVTYSDKTNVNPIISRVNQSTAEDWNEVKAILNATVKRMNNYTRHFNLTLNYGTTTITIDPPLDPAVVDTVTVAVQSIRRISDNAVIDWDISNESKTSFDITVWDNGVSVKLVTISKFL